MVLWRWQIVDPDVPVTAVVLVAEALRSAATRAHKEAGFGLLPDAVHRDDEPSHSHAFWLPGDDDGDGMIDHAWVYCANGLPSTVLAALALTTRVRVAGRVVRLSPSWMGPLFADGPFGPARVWSATTPYVTPQWRLTKTGREREDFTPEAQVRKEIAARGLPEPCEIVWHPTMWTEGGAIVASSFETTRRKSGASVGPPKDALASFPTVTFAKPIMGPLALGFGAHFGLGQLMPVA